MFVYALFDNETAELVVIRFLNAAVEKLLDIYLHSFQSPNVQESAKRGIQCAHELIFSEEIGKYYQTTPISVTLKDFNQQVDGSSAGLAYALAFAAALKDRKIINTLSEVPNKIAATGELDNCGNVVKIKNLKQKIIAAIKENVNLMFYPSQNFEELNILRQSDSMFDSAIKGSNIILKHVSTLKQAFCELGLFPNPTISIESIKASNSNIISSLVSLYNDIHLDIKSFSLMIKYDSRIKLDKSFESNLAKINKNVNYTTGKDNMLLTFNTEHDISNLLTNSTKLFEIRFLPVDGSDRENKFEINFEVNNCTINGDSCESIGGISLNSSFISNHSTTFYNINNPQDNKANNFIMKHKKSFILAGILFTCLAVTAYVSLVLTNKKTTLSSAASSSTPAITSSVVNSSPSQTFIAAATSSPEPTVIPSPTPTQENMATPTQENMATPTQENTATPTTNKATPSPSRTVIASVKPSKSIIRTTTPPSHSLTALNLDNINDFTAWKVKNISCESKLSSVEGYLTDKAVKIDYNIIGNGSVSIKTKPGAVSISSNKYKKLSFYYKCISEESCQDTVNIKVNSSTNTFHLGTTQNISSSGEWLKKEIDLSNFKEITSFEVFIGSIASDSSTNKGSLILCNFVLTP